MKRLQLEKFQNTVWEHYRRAGRYDLPWRKTNDPYRTLVAEVMLQQTQISRVLKKYSEFLKAFPTFKALAKSPVSRILAVWKGMGYNRRALMLKRLAHIVVRDYAGKLPKDERELLQLPGVGPYTAGALRVFAFDRPAVFMDTNIRRVFIHSFFASRLRSQVLKNLRIRDSAILPLIEKSMDKKRPREWYWALMDYGAYLAKSGRNANRQSAHYAVQSKFKGSRREARGKILWALSQKPSDIKALSTAAGRTNKETSSILATLAKEGFVTKQNNRYRIAV